MTEFTGRSVAEAIEIGLETMNVSQDEVDIEILEEGRGGVFGLGHKPAAVRITLRGQDAAPVAATTDPEPAPNNESGTEAVSDEPEEMIEDDLQEDAVIETEEASETLVADEEIAVADESPPELGEPEPEEAEVSTIAGDEDDEVITLCKDFLQNMLDLMGLTTEVEASIVPPESKGKDPVYLLNIEGEDLGILIGRRGETLEAIQYLVRLTVNRHTHNWPRIEVDVEHYKERRESSLQRLAETMAERAVRSERTVTLEAMPARERRLIHLALKDRDDVYTESIGEGDNRKVTIVPVETP